MTVMLDDAFVRHVQKLLAEKGVYTGAIDGIAGTATQAALLKVLGLSAPPVEPPPAPTPSGRTLDARSEAKLVGVHPDLVKVVRRAAEIAPVPFVVLEGLRTLERQKQLVASGASKTLNSRHLEHKGYGHAFDAAPLDANGQVSWDWPLYHKLAPAIKTAAHDVGVPIEWGGDWKSFKDGPHWQLPWGAYP